MSAPLALPSLSISGFRCFESLDLPALARVTLLAGKNSVGKTTVLDAVRLFASRGGGEVIGSLLEERGEVILPVDPDEESSYAYWASVYGPRAPLLPDLAALFHRESGDGPRKLSIGSQEGPDTLTIEGHYTENLETGSLFALRVRFRETEQELSHDSVARQGRRGSFSGARSRSRRPGKQRGIPVQRMGPSVPQLGTLAALWDRVAVTDDERVALDALALTLDSKLGRLAFVQSPRGRLALVRLEDEDTRQPLSALGDGALRLLGTALALVNARGGFLLLDEVENGIHHTIQTDYWRLVLRLARGENVQVFATTHSWDALASFAEAVDGASGNSEDAVLVRLQREEGGVRAVSYRQEELKTAVKEGIEVR